MSAGRADGVARTVCCCQRDSTLISSSRTWTSSSGGIDHPQARSHDAFMMRTVGAPLLDAQGIGDSGLIYLMRNHHRSCACS